ncbi:DUF6286 domain-containing protein [Streptomyces stramineus]|uniref:DUF6286 domain-containing protein n=1 Tax=Streptomyces stramineus TaxID=173861 RepID=A0ABP3LAG3_9ACTN
MSAPGTAPEIPRTTDEGAADERAPAGSRRAGRFWSVRRLPAVLVSAVVLGAAGILLYDVAAVRAHRPAMSWRRRLAHELATRPLDSGWVAGGAAAAVLAGLWLILLALTPGLRGLLPMRRDTPDVRAGLERRAAALILRDRAMEVAGVQSVRVDVGRRRVRARARSHFRDLAEVRADLDTVLADGLRQLGLARQPRLTLSVRRPVKR